jgi:adenine-specific DNA-methyltransferase
MGIEKVKNDGQVFTPDFIVKEMLDNINYNSEEIVNKHIIDNSCGDGAFLCEIVSRYVKFASLTKTKEEVSEDLSTYIHGIDVDDEAIEMCISKLNSIIKSCGLSDVNWDIKIGDALIDNTYDNMMDYVVGNPPYVRIHNINENREDVKKFTFANSGMTDLYLVFFEIGFKMLNKNGVMTYITPSSWLSSLAGTELRRFIQESQNMLSLVDLGHYQAFDGVTTYTIISTFSKSIKSKSFEYYEFDKITKKSKIVETLTYDDCVIDNCFYLSDKKTLKNLRQIKSVGKSEIKVKNGFATLSDKSFIGDSIPESEITIPVLKASTGKWSKCLFPYDKNGKPLPKEIIFSNDCVKKHYENQKEKILKGKSEYDGWWLYGRTQALNDVWKDKVAINVLIKDIKDLKIEEVKSGSGIYSGLYILGCEVDIVKKTLMTHDFINYLKALKKYKSGGYYTFSSKDLEQYLIFSTKM